MSSIKKKMPSLSTNQPSVILPFIDKLCYESGLLPSVVSCRSLQQVSHLIVSLPEWYITFARIILFFSRQGGLQPPQPPRPVR